MPMLYFDYNGSNDLLPSFGRLVVNNYDVDSDKDKFLPFKKMSLEKIKSYLKKRKTSSIIKDIFHICMTLISVRRKLQAVRLEDFLKH
jgi:hypothetical protein